MPNQIRSQNSLSTKDVESRRLSQDYYVEKSQTGNDDGDHRLQQSIWSFLKAAPDLDISEVEVDVSDGVVTVMGTFPTAQIQGRIVHGIMNIVGVRRLVDETHVLNKHELKNSSEEF